MLTSLDSPKIHYRCLEGELIPPKTPEDGASDYSLLRQGKGLDSLHGDLM